MADTLNLDAASGRNIIEDGSTPALELSNAGTGEGLKVSSVADIAAEFTGSGVATIAVIKLTNSLASSPVMEFGSVDKSVVSTASGCATLAYGIRVKVGNTYGWIPVLKTIA
jgi:hypothetical protein